MVGVMVRVSISLGVVITNKQMRIRKNVRLVLVNGTSVRKNKEITTMINKMIWEQ